LDTARFFAERLVAAQALLPLAGYAEEHARYLESLRKRPAIVPYFTGLAESSDLIGEAIAADDREALAAAIDRANDIAQEAFEGMPDDFREFAGLVSKLAAA
jgi:hypothetical protein